MSKVNKFALFISSLLCIYHFFALVYYARAIERESNAGLTSLEGSLNAQLSDIHLGLLFLLMVFVIVIRDKRLICKIVSSIVSFLALGIYYWWYFEKYNYLRVWGIREKTIDYQIWLTEIGLFRGAATLDYWVFLTTLLLTFYALLRLCYTLFKSNNKLY